MMYHFRFHLYKAFPPLSPSHNDSEDQSVRERENMRESESKKNKNKNKERGRVGGFHGDSKDRIRVIERAILRQCQERRYRER